jgi:hypothetical protein
MFVEISFTMYQVILLLIGFLLGIIFRTYAGSTLISSLQLYKEICAFYFKLKSNKIFRSFFNIIVGVLIGLGILNIFRYL